MSDKEILIILPKVIEELVNEHSKKLGVDISTINKLMIDSCSKVASKYTNDDNVNLDQVKKECIDTMMNTYFLTIHDACDKGNISVSDKLDIISRMGEFKTSVDGIWDIGVKTAKERANHE
jgi:stage III sporulation protein SpoIIIAA